MSIGVFLKVVALVLWFLAGIAPRITAIAPWGGSFVAAGLFFWFVTELIAL